MRRYEIRRMWESIMIGLLWTWSIRLGEAMTLYQYRLMEKMNGSEYVYTYGLGNDEDDVLHPCPVVYEDDDQKPYLVEIEGMDKRLGRDEIEKLVEDGVDYRCTIPPSTEFSIRDRIERVQGKASIGRKLAKQLYPRGVYFHNVNDILENITEKEYDHLMETTDFRVCVISDSASQKSLDASFSNGALPSMERIYVDQQSKSITGSDEATAMLEIIHSINPFAKLGFSSGIRPGRYIGSFQNLRDTGGCNMIVDDLYFASHPIFTYGEIHEIVDDYVDNHDGVYFSSAGNYGNFRGKKDDESFSSRTYRSKLDVESQNGFLYHIFSRAASPPRFTLDIANTGTGENFLVYQWNDLYDRGVTAATRIRLFVIDKDSCVKDRSTQQVVLDSCTILRVGVSNPEPYGFIGVPAMSGLGLVVSVEKYSPELSPTPILLHFTSFSTNLKVKFSRDDTENLDFQTMWGHTCAEKTLSIAAISATFDSDYDGIDDSFQTSEVERFSSQGPCYFEFRSVPGENDGLYEKATIDKPNYSAASGVETTVPLFTYFAGTSASGTISILPHLG